ncbi:MAG: uncharacterized protein HW380_2275 [Magnetococcales bacterium]|nr:uncharacterized protein [Magnetococcales bacterium]
METISLQRTERTPNVLFNFATNCFSLTGESYPEDVSEFYGSLMAKLKEHLGLLRKAELQFDFSLVYFNSSTAKVIMRLFELLEQTAQRGNQVLVNWHYDEDDDNMREMGEDFSEDLKAARFNLVSRTE